MSKKLLHKTLRVYILFSLIVMVIMAPLFYYATEKLFIEDADEALFLFKKEFFTNNLSALKESDVERWNKISRDVKIEPSTLLKKDSVFYRSYLDTLANENEPYRVLLTPISIQGKAYSFMARVNLIESSDLITNIALLFCLVLVLLLAGLYFITRKLSLKLWLPFYSTLQQVEQFELNKNVNPTFVKTDVEEFTRLNQSINKLLEKNLTVYKDQKEFIENAAHELQTPVAVFQAKLDVLAQQIPFTNEVGHTLSHLNESIARLNRINKNLLLLSKIENDQYLASEQVSVSDILKKQIAFLREQSEERNVVVMVEKLDSCVIKANGTLLEIAISNLLLNALRHNISDGRIAIKLERDILIISNTSEYQALSSQKMFQRFSNTRSTGGNGLGLAIVKKICDQHSWAIKYIFEDDTHIFQVTF